MAGLQFDNQQVDPYLCNTRASKQFWKEQFKTSMDYLGRLDQDRAMDSATLGKLKPEMLISVGDRVTVKGQPGSVKFVGFVDDATIAPSLKVGVKFDESVLLGHDGMFQGKRYFNCLNGHGIFVRYQDVKPLRPASKRPPVKGNPMFPSWPEISKRRKQREAMLEEAHMKSLRASQTSTSATPRPPAYPPRDNRAMQLRVEKATTSVNPAHFLIIKDDPCDMAIKDHQKRTKNKLIVASLSTPEATQANWEQKLVQQWRRTHDPDKASRMSETLFKLCSAYKEGFKYKHCGNSGVTYSH